MSEQSHPNTLTEIETSLEAVLFAAGGPIPVGQLASVLEYQQEQIEKGLHSLQQNYRSQGRGINLQLHAGRVQLTTSPYLSSVVEKFLGYETISHLSQAALETLAIIAYRQPITRPGIDAIRGVNSDAVLKSLLNKGLLQEIGRSEGPGRPILYGITSDFLQHFGLSSISELPPYEILGDGRPIPQGNGLLKD